MTKGNSMNNFKRVLIIALCSILCVCTVPRFSLRSEAASTATYALYETLLTLSGYLASKGYSTFHNLDLTIPSVRELKEWTQEEQEDLLFDFAAELNSYGTNVGFPGLGDEILRALRLAGISGYLTLSQGARIAFDNWIYGNTENGAVSVGTISEPISNYFNEAGTIYNVYVSGYLNSVYFDFPTIALYERYNALNRGYVIILPASIEDWTFNAPGSRYEYETQGTLAQYSRDYVNYNGFSYYYNVYTVTNFIASDLYFVLPNADSINTDSIVTNYLSGSLDEVVQGTLGTKQITDTSGTDLLTSTNTIASDGTVEGDTTIYLPDTATLEDAIDSYNNQSITLDEFLKILGINSVESDATVQEKEDALTVVVTPSEDYLWFTKTQWGADAIEETRKASASTRAEEDSLADSIANTANGGSDPEDPDNKSRGKGLLALLLLGLGIWNTPIIAGDGTPDAGGTDDGSGDGSGDTSGYLAESIAGMAVAGSLVDDLFDSAGGSDGYGLIYTVGASFVIFSVIIGAANYFGALFHGSDTKQNIKASGKRSNPGKDKKGG